MDKGHPKCPLSTISGISRHPLLESKLPVSCNHETKKNNARFAVRLYFPVCVSVIVRSPAEATTASANKDAQARDAGQEKTSSSSGIISKTGYRRIPDTGKAIAISIQTTFYETAPRPASENAFEKPVCKIELIFCNPLNLKRNS